DPSGNRLGAQYEALRSAVSALGAAVCTLDSRGRLQYVNRAGEQLLGWRQEELAGEDILARIGLINRATTARLLRQIVRSGKAVRPENAVIRVHNDQTIPVSYILKPILDNRTTAGAILIILDRRERCQLEEQLRQAQKMETVGQLAGGIAHDFNNLLTVITGYGELLREVVDPAWRSQVGIIIETARRAADLTQHLLKFSRRQGLEPQPIGLNQVIGQVDKILRRLIGEHIQLSSRLESGLPRIQADPGQIEQVILNLAVNARDAMPEGGQLTIKTRSAQIDKFWVGRHSKMEPGRYVLLEVSDTGLGMDEATQQRIFEPFFTTKSQNGGTGLGLATVYSIVKQHNGAIQVVSQPGQGTCFRIYFPSIGGDAPPDRIVGLESDAAQGGSETILVVEDLGELRHMIQAILEGKGYEVLTAANGVDALKLANAHNGKINLMLTDMVMPEMGGLELSENFLAQHPETKILYISGYTDTVDLDGSTLGEQRDFLQKPFNPGSLAQKVRQLLDSRQ
ncbi:MAG: ATP-binding protein, partial [Acidobacteriota bacterium]